MGLGVLGLSLVSQLDWIPSILISTVCFASMGVGAKIRKRGMRLEQLPAREVLARDKRPPIVLIRPFRIDDKEITAPGAKKHVMFTHEWYRGQAGFSMEQAIVDEFEAYGPVVAVGRPHERIQPLGASRLYVGTSEGWEAAVLALFRDAQRIIAIVGSGPGIRWELEQVIASPELRSRAIFIAPPLEASSAQPWARLQKACAQWPSVPDDTFAVIFDRDGNWKTILGPASASNWAQHARGLAHYHR